MCVWLLILCWVVFAVLEDKVRMPTDMEEWVWRTCQDMLIRLADWPRCSQEFSWSLTISYKRVNWTYDSPVLASESVWSPTSSFTAPTPRFHPKNSRVIQLYHLPWFGPISLGPCGRGRRCWRMRSTQPTKQPKVLGSKRIDIPKTGRLKDIEHSYIHGCFRK